MFLLLYKLQVNSQWWQYDSKKTTLTPQQFAMQCIVP